MGVAGVAYASRGENLGGNRGAAAADEEDPTIPRAAACTSSCVGSKMMPASWSSPPLAPDVEEKTLLWG